MRPCEGAHVFVTQIEPTSDFMVNLFEIKFSPGGSNRREDEEQVVMYWIHFIEMIDSKL